MGNALLHWLEQLPVWLVQSVNFLLLVLEGTGLPAVPYEASMLAIGLIAKHDLLVLVWGILIGATGNTLGNLIGYYLGPRGMRLISDKTKRAMGIETIHDWTRRYGPWMTVISRWFGPVRTLFILSAREGGMRPLPFVLYSFVGALSWTAVWQTGLWLGGQVFVEVWHRYQLYGVAALVVIGVPIVYVLWRRRRAKERAAEVAERESQAGM
jgi:membrane protein DedA with SNARE-associated domain